MYDIIDTIGIQLLTFVICLYYGIRLIVTKNASCIRGKNAAPLKNEEKYSVEAGKLVIFFGIATLIMAGLVYIDVVIALIEIIAATIVLMFFWKKMHSKYA